MGAVAPAVRFGRGGGAVYAAAAGVDDGIAVMAAALPRFLGYGIGDLTSARSVAAW